MPDPYWVLEKLTKTQQKKLLRTLLSHPLYGEIVVKELFPNTGQRALDSGYADVLVERWAEESDVAPPSALTRFLPRMGLAPRLNAALTTVARAQTTEPGLAMYAEGAGPTDALLKDIFRKSDIESAFESWNKSRQDINLAAQAGGGLGALRAVLPSEPTPTFRELGPFKGTFPPSPVSPEGGISGETAIEEGVIGTGGVNPAEALAKGLGSAPAFKRGVTDPAEMFYDVNDRIATIRDQMSILLSSDDPWAKGEFKNLAAELDSLEAQSKQLMPYMFQKEQMAAAAALEKEKLGLNREELEFRRQEAGAVAGRHAAGLQQSAAQFSERMAFEREQERANLMKYQEDLNNQLRQLTMQAAQLNLPEGFQFEGPYGPVTPPTTQVTLPTQATNVQAALAAAGA